MAKVYIKGYGNSIWIRPRSSDLKVAYGLFTRDEFGFDWPYSEPPATIIDAGANVGFASIAMKKRWPMARIVALEPDAENFEMLMKNCGTMDGFHALQKGLWDKECNLVVNPASLKNGKWGLQFMESGPDVLEACPATEIGALLSELKWHSCDLVKLDIEGAETQVLRHSSTWIKNIKALLVEPHDDDALAAIDSVSKGRKRRQEGEKVFLWE